MAEKKILMQRVRSVGGGRWEMADARDRRQMAGDEKRSQAAIASGRREIRWQAAVTGGSCWPVQEQRKHAGKGTKGRQ